MKTVFTSLSFLFFSIAYTQNSNKAGTLDSSFGHNGKVVSETYQGLAYASVIQEDGKIVIGGGGTYYKGNTLLKGSLLARCNTNGSPDLSFADSGRGVYILGDTGIYIPTIHSMALQPDGKIVALGSFAIQNGVLGSFSLMRFNSDGSPDESFGIKGLTVTEITGGPDGARDIALLSDGRILVTGNLADINQAYDRGFIACYTPEGKLDKSFADAGIAALSLDQALSLSAIAITTDNKIIVGGKYGLGTNSDDILLRYNNNGTSDPSFGENGMAKMFFSDNTDGTTLNDIAIDKDGKIVTDGVYYLQNGIAAIKAGRFTKAGFPDSTFNNSGYTYTKYSKGNSFANAIAIQQNERIIAAGYTSVGDSGTFTIARYNPDGSIDSAFGINGIQNTIFYNEDIAYSVNVQKDGKIVLAGNSLLDNIESVDIARYNGDLSQKQILITKIRHWIQHHNGIEWDNVNGVSNYVVQRSYDGIHFNSIARINAGTQSNFTYTDPMPLSGNNYYRLQTTSVSGVVNFSNIIVVSNNDIKISPNPATNILHIQGLPLHQQIKLTVVDLAGNTAITCPVYYGSQQLTANGNSSYNLNIASLKQGNYLLKIETNDEVLIKQFVKE